VQLALPTDQLRRYKSPSQRARVATEAWAETNLFCPNCASSRVTQSQAGTPAVDYICPECESLFQLKSQSRAFSRRITDAAYEAMRRAIEQDATPNLLVLHYEPEAWRVRNLVLVPSFIFTMSAVEERNPLGPKARRAGWIGCNIVLSNIPPDARISVVVDGVARSPEEVRRQYARLRPLAKLRLERRGWTLDVLNAIRSLGRPEFSLSEVYALEASLARLHPANRHVRDKIRQQLQVLRDLGFLRFLGAGDYCLCH
jgi:type II restriction enzyme